MTSEDHRSASDTGDDSTRTVTGARRVLPAGTMLADRYRIIEVIGAGGMGVVYKARDQSLDIEVAVKLLSGEYSDDPDALERFRREIRLARRVTHQNVIRIHDIGVDGELMFLTMDYVPGRTLREWLTEAPLSETGAANIAIQLAEGLAEAHRNDIIHRDMKPSNILVDEQGHAWLSDFGIARAIGQQGLTRAGQVIGTTAYLAPEQIRGDEVDERTDLYALGLVLWEMLTGKIPLTGDTREETIARRSSARLPPTMPESDRVSTKLERIVRRCLAPDPDDRYPNAEALLHDLRRGRSSLNWRRAARRSAAAGIVLAAVAAAGYWIPEFGQGPETADGPPLGVGVLPFVNLTENPDHDWIRRGAPETIATSLAENPELRVIEPIRINRALSDLRLSPANLGRDEFSQIGELFGAERIVKGQLLGSGAELRLQLSVFRDDGEQASVIRVEVEPAGILAGIDHSTRRLIEELRVVAPTQTGSLPMSSEAGALSAFDAGITALARGNFQDSIEQLEASVERDAGFGMAWLRLSDAYEEAGYYDRALDAAERAAGLLSDHGGRAEAWARARQASLAGRVEDAIEQFRHITENYPGDVDARLALAELLSQHGELKAASALARDVTEADPGHPRAWFLLGKFAVMSGEVRAAAEDYLVKALVIQNRLANPEGRAEVLNGLGIAHERLGELDSARNYYQEAAELRDEAGDKRGLSASLSNLGRLNMIHGDYDQAREALEEALGIREEIGDLKGMAATYNEFGVLEEEVGDYKSALAHYKDSLRIYEQLGDSGAATQARTSIGFIYLMLGQYENSEVFVQRAMEQQRAAGDNHGLMISQEIMGELEITRGNWSGAQNRLLDALTIARDIDNPFAEASIHGSIGRLAAFQGRVSDALDAFDTALEILEPLDDTRGLAEYHLQTAELLLTLKLPAQARQRWERASDYIADITNLSQRARVIRAEAVLAAMSGQPAEAGSALDEAMQLAQASGSELIALRVQESRLRWIGGDLGAFESLADQADRLGHRPMHLETLSMLAEKQREAERLDAARSTIRTATRPPLRLEPWIGNWKLHAIGEKLIAAAEGDSPMSFDSRALLARLADNMPSDLRAEFARMHGLE